MTAEASTSFTQSRWLRLAAQPRFLLIAVLTISWVLRWLAFVEGGQEYWPDESRFQGSRAIVGQVVAGEWRAAADSLFAHADHTLFRWIGIPAAALERIAPTIPWVPSVYFSLFSVLAIYLLFRVSRAAGATDQEAVLAASVYAATGSLFVFSRHYLPYDSSLCMVLVAWELSLRVRRSLDCFAVGFVAGCAFLIYNGHWLIAGTVLVVHVIGSQWVGQALVRCFFALIGLFVPLGGVVLGGWWLGHDLISEARNNAGTIVQGDFGIGYRLIPEYLWSSDGWIAILLALGFVGSVFSVVRRTASRRLHTYVLGAAFLLVGLIVLSDLRPTFVVYGRLTRTLVPLLCLMFAAVVYSCLSTRSRSIRTALMASLVLWLVAGGALNLWPVLSLRFPREFRAEALRRADRLEAGGAAGMMRIVNAQHLWGEQLVPSLPPHEELWRVAHPLRYAPYQLEGFSQAQRRTLQEGDIDMRLVRVLAGARAVMGDDVDNLQPYLGPLRINLRLPADAVGRPEPILTAGANGAACFVYLVYEDATTVRVGFDNWGYGAVLSDPISLQGLAHHVIELSVGALYPPAIRERLSVLSDTVVVRFNGVNVLARRVPFHPTSPDQIDIGRNRIGGSASGIEFTGTIERIERIALNEALSWFPSVEQLAVRRGLAWSGSAGPFRIRAHLGEPEPGRQSALMDVPMGGGNGLILVDELGADLVRFGFRFHSAGAITWSEPQRVASDRMVELDVGGGPLLPADAPETGLDLLAWERARRLLTVDQGKNRILQLPVAVPSDEATAPDVVKDEPESLGEGVRPFAGMIQSIEPLAAKEYLDRAADVSRLIGPGVDGRRWAGFPGALAIELSFAVQSDHGSLGQPLLVSGQTGAGDFVYLRSAGDGYVQVGYDHWGSADERASDPIKLVPGQVVRVVLVGGPLMPPLGAAIYQERPDLLAWRSRLRIELEEKVIFDREVPVHATGSDSLTVGVNRIGGSTTTPRFSGEIRSVLSLRSRLEPGL